ncbi:hypothetical protein BV898_14296 [Hypsibius exemplaris]|uniref:Uncharacterized protein n=1 Tax=Hypsibius exemplaris TaxID=2072580 RepID=A0A1W0W892_HYPEX|nr:hypothetical protein BV898_14296 [Hypsibius exemplaris]
MMEVAEAPPFPSAPCAFCCYTQRHLRHARTALLTVRALREDEKKFRTLQEKTNADLQAKTNADLQAKTNADLQAENVSLTAKNKTLRSDKFGLLEQLEYLRARVLKAAVGTQTDESGADFDFSHGRPPHFADYSSSKYSPPFLESACSSDSNGNKLRRSPDCGSNASDSGISLPSNPPSSVRNQSSDQSTDLSSDHSPSSSPPPAQPAPNAKPRAKPAAKRTRKPPVAENCAVDAAGVKKCRGKKKVLVVEPLDPFLADVFGEIPPADSAAADSEPPIPVTPSVVKVIQTQKENASFGASPGNLPACSPKRKQAPQLPRPPKRKAPPSEIPSLESLFGDTAIGVVPATVILTNMTIQPEASSSLEPPMPELPVENGKCDVASRFSVAKSRILPPKSAREGVAKCPRRQATSPETSPEIMNDLALESPLPLPYSAAVAVYYDTLQLTAALCEQATYTAKHEQATTDLFDNAEDEDGMDIASIMAQVRVAHDLLSPPSSPMAVEEDCEDSISDIMNFMRMGSWTTLSPPCSPMLTAPEMDFDDIVGGDVVLLHIPDDDGVDVH